MENITTHSNKRKESTINNYNNTLNVNEQLQEASSMNVYTIDNILLKRSNDKIIVRKNFSKLNKVIINLLSSYLDIGELVIMSGLNNKFKHVFSHIRIHAEIFEFCKVSFNHILLKTKKLITNNCKDEFFDNILYVYKHYSSTDNCSYDSFIFTFAYFIFKQKLNLKYFKGVNIKDCVYLLDTFKYLDKESKKCLKLYIIYGDFVKLLHDKFLGNINDYNDYIQVLYIINNTNQGLRFNLLPQVSNIMIKQIEGDDISDITISHIVLFIYLL